MTQYRNSRASLARSQRKLQSAATRLRLHWRYLIRTGQAESDRETSSPSMPRAATSAERDARVA